MSFFEELKTVDASDILVDENVFEDLYKEVPKSISCTPSGKSPCGGPAWCDSLKKIFRPADAADVFGKTA